MHPWELKRYTMQQFVDKAKGYRKSQEAAMRQHWEMTRAIAFSNAAIEGKELKRGTGPASFMPFPWDKGQQGQENLRDRIRVARQRYIDAGIISNN